MVPLLAPKEQADERDEQAVNAAHIEILKRVIRQVRVQKTPTNEAATQIVVRQYSERIKRLRRKNTSPRACSSFALRPSSSRRPRWISISAKDVSPASRASARLNALKAQGARFYAHIRVARRWARYGAA